LRIQTAHSTSVPFGLMSAIGEW